MHASLMNQCGSGADATGDWHGGGPNHRFLQKRKSKREANREERDNHTDMPEKQKSWGSSVSRTSPVMCRTGCENENVGLLVSRQNISNGTDRALS